MKQNNDLFSLIKQMEKNEKRHFILSSGIQKGNKNYVELFKALEKEKIYDERAFRQRHAEKKFSGNFAYNKIHLYKLLISSLAACKFDGSIDGQMQMMIAECRILFNKEMFRKYFKALAKAKEYAYRYERFGYLLQIIDIEKFIIPKELIYSSKAEDLKNEVRIVTEKINNIMEYSSLAGMLLKNFRYYGLARDKEREAELKKLACEDIMKDPLNAKSSRALEGYWRVKEIAAGITGDNTGLYRALKGRLNAVTANPDPFKGYLIDFRHDILLSLTECAIRMNDTDEAVKMLAVINEYYRINKVKDADESVIIAYFELRIFLKSGELEKALKIIPKLFDYLSVYKGKLQIDTEFSIMYYSALAFFEYGYYTKALEAINMILTHPLLNKKSDLECYSRILNLLIHYELKNFELLKHLLISTYRYLRRHEKLFKTEQLVIDFIRKLANIKNDDDLKFYFGRYAKKLERLKAAKFEKNAFEYIDLLKWVKASCKKL